MRQNVSCAVEGGLITEWVGFGLNWNYVIFTFSNVFEFYFNR